MRKRCGKGWTGWTDDGRGSRFMELRTQNVELLVAPVLRVSLTIHERRGPGGSEAAI